MREFYEKQFDYFRNEFSLRCELYPTNARKNIIMNVTPEALVCLKEANECLDNYYIAQDLKQYRPQRKPITPQQLRDVSKKAIKSEAFQRKRRNIVRDWLYFIVWYVRLKRILEQHKLSGNGSSISDLLSCKAKSKHAEIELKSPLQDPTQLSLSNLAFGLPSLQLRIFEDAKRMEDFYCIGSSLQQQQKTF